MFSSDQAEHVRRTLATTGWADILHPMLRKQRADIVTQMGKLPSERPEPYRQENTDVLLGRLRQIDSFLDKLKNELAAEEHNRQLDELDAARTANP